MRDLFGVEGAANRLGYGGRRRSRPAQPRGGDWRAPLAAVHNRQYEGVA
jgi:hypothetical protein